MVSFGTFRHHLQSLDHRNKRLNLRRLSLRADLLHQRCIGLPVEFRHVMQADFVLFLRHALQRSDNDWLWWPETLPYVGRYSGAFEVFARSKSSSYFDRAKVLLGVENKETLTPLLEDLARTPSALPRWEFNSINPAALLAFDQIATKP